MISSESLSTFGDRLSNRAPQKRFPYSGQWELTCRCNLRCAMCYTDCLNFPSGWKKELSFSEIERIMREVAAAGCVELVLTGGEPLARPDFSDIYLLAYRLGFVLTVFTNATLITDAAADLWQQHPPKTIEVTIHGLSAKTFDGVTQKPGSHEQFQTGLDRLLSRGLPVTLKTAATTLNQDEIVGVYRYAREKGLPFRLGEQMRNDLQLSGAPFQFQLPDDILERIADQEPALRSEKETPNEEPVCGGGQETFHIDAYGGLQLCSNNRRRSFDLKQGSFLDGFYKFFPQFPCPKRDVSSVEKITVVSHT